MKKILIALCGFSTVGLYGAAGKMNVLHNVNIGKGALQTLKNGINNVAIGEGTLPHLEEGNGNIAIGSPAGDGLKKGSNNIFLGSGAVENEQNDTIAIGYDQKHVKFYPIRASKNPGKNHRVVVIDEEGWLTAVPFEELEKLTRSSMPSVPGGPKQ